MNRLRIVILLIVGLKLITVFSIKAQSTVLEGTIRDALSKEAIPYCQIKWGKLKTMSDLEGKFAFDKTASSETNYIICTYIGYFSDTFMLDDYKSNVFFLRPKENTTLEVTVSGVSKATFINENPIAISLVNTKTIEQANESNIIDVLTKNVAGLNAVKTGPNISKPFIRGLGYNRVLTLYDGVRQEGQQWGDEHGIEVDAYNIEKAEVIKGPASLMYGSDALAGVISLMPAQPKAGDSTIHAKSFSEFQHNNQMTGNGARITYANTHWAYALSASYRIAKNYQNSIDGRVYNTGFQEKNASGYISYKIKQGYSSLSLTLYDNYQGIPDGSRDSLSRKFTYQIFENQLDDQKNRPIVSDKSLNAYQLSPLHQHIQHYRLYTNNLYVLRKGEIEALFALQQNNRLEYNHPTNPAQAGMSVSLNTLNYAIKYHLPKIGNYTFSLGSNGMRQTNTNKAATDFPIPDYSLLDAGAFAYGKWKQNRMTISGGIRYDIREIKANDFYTSTDPNTGFSQQVSDTTGASLQFPSFHKTFQGVSFSMGSTYQLSEKISLKANIGRGYRAPSITEFASNGLDPGANIVYIGNRNFNPEFSLQEDLGIFGTFKNISTSVSIFNNQIQNYIYLSQLTDNQNKAVEIVKGYKTYQYQQDGAQLYGTEITLNLHDQHHKSIQFNNSLSLVYGNNTKHSYQNKGVQGEYLPFIPPMKILNSISKTIQPKSMAWKDLTLKLESDFSAAQNRYLALENTETKTPSFHLWHISSSISYQFSPQSSLQLMLQINNLLDTNYQSNLSRLKYFEIYSDSPNGKTGLYGMGRNVCLKVIWSI